MITLDLKGQTALITGASKGIGLAAARAFAEAGCHLHLGACDRAALEAPRAEITAAHGVRVTIHAMDLSAPGCMRHLGGA